MGIESSIDTPLAEAVRKVGSQSGFARIIGRSQTSVFEWLRDRKPLPAEYVLDVERETGLSRHFLRSDLYPVDNAGDASLEPAR